jgi:EAL domain-containing protein (putative c-di-GMP-specific phosphodiesterase class I)
VEPERIADEVTALGADLGQGWLFGRPRRPRTADDAPVSGFQPVAAGRG